METRATLYGVRLSAQKGRLVADQIRGLPVEKALNLLAFSPKKGAHIIKKVLESAIANAEHNDGADVDELKVKTILVEQAMSLKRFQARAKGRGNRIMVRQQQELRHDAERGPEGPRLSEETAFPCFGRQGDDRTAGQGRQDHHP